MARLLITDVTRMKGTNVCVAGLSGEQAVRLNDPAPNEDLLRRLGDLKPGDVVEVNWTTSDSVSHPHTEDSSWNLATAKKLGSRTEAQFKEIRQQQAVEQVTEAFGEVYITGSGGNFAFRPDKGSRSLLTLLAHDVKVYVDFGKIRVAFSDSERPWKKVALEDLIVRNHEASCRSCKRSLPRNLERDFNSESALLRVGLSRPFAPPGHDLACWVQVNGIYPLDRDRQHFV